MFEPPISVFNQADSTFFNNLRPCFDHSGFEFVSDFDIRHSNLITSVPFSIRVSYTMTNFEQESLTKRA